MPVTSVMHCLKCWISNGQISLQIGNEWHSVRKWKASSVSNDI